MESRVLYVSKTGNTEKIASVIASELKIQKINIAILTDDEKPAFWKENQAKIYWIGSGIYGSHVEKRVLNFFKQYPPPEGTIFAFFATWVGRGTSGTGALQSFENILRNQSSDIRILKPFFLCYGKTFIARRHHPSELDLESAKEWTRKLWEKENPP